MSGELFKKIIASLGFGVVMVIIGLLIVITVASLGDYYHIKYLNETSGAIAATVSVLRWLEDGLRYIWSW